MGIDVYVSNQTINKWFNSILKELDFLNDCTIHKNLDSLYNSLLNVNNARVVLLDIEDRASCEYVASIKNGFENVHCVAIGLNRSIGDVFTYFNLGFSSYIDLSYSAIEVYQAIHKSLGNSKYLSTAQQELLLEHLSHNLDGLAKCITIPSSSNGHNCNYGNGDSIKYSEKSLTEKEKKVCEFLLKGFTYKEIANSLGVTSFTINQRVKGIYKKLQVRSRSELSFRYLS